MADGPPVARLRQYLRDLKPEARSLLIVELERGLLRGDAPDGAQLVLQELRRLARETGRPASRGGNLPRLFFQAIEPFLVDDVAEHRHPGRIARVALEPIWEWVCRDLLPGEAKAVTEAVARAVGRQDLAHAEELARNFQDRFARRAQEALDAADADEAARRRLAGEIATPRGIEDVRSIVEVLKARDALENFAIVLPRHIAELSGAMLGLIKERLDAVPSQDRTAFVQRLLVVMSRLAAPWQLAKIATCGAGTTSAQALAENRYGVAIAIVLAEVGRMVAELKSELKTGRGVAVGALLKSIHDAVCGLRAEVDFSVDCPWARELAAACADTSNVLKDEIEPVPGHVERLLRPRASHDIAPGSSIDRGDVSDTEARIAFVGTCRQYASGLDIGDVAQKAWSALETNLSAVTEPLAEALRGAGDSDRDFRRSQFDAAMRFSAVVFGPDHAAAMARSVAEAGERRITARAS